MRCGALSLQNEDPTPRDGWEKEDQRRATNESRTTDETRTEDERKAEDQRKTEFQKLKNDVITPKNNRPQSEKKRVSKIPKVSALENPRDKRP